MTISVQYNNNITSITKVDGKYIRHLKNGSSEEILVRDAVYDLAGMYVHFLTSNGKNPLAFDTASKPCTVLDTILTDDGTYNGKPLLDEDFTADMLTSIMQGIDTYCNKKCKNHEVAYGIGQFMYKVYQPYELKPSERIQKLFATFIITGMFIMQMKRKPLARSMYLGIYDAWQWCKNYQIKIFKKQHVKDTCDNLLECTDVFNDPIHDIRKSPQNFRKYSIDNIIMVVYITARMVRIHQEHPFLNKEDSENYEAMGDFGLILLDAGLKYYDLRCQYFLAPDNEKEKISYSTECKGSSGLDHLYGLKPVGKLSYDAFKNAVSQAPYMRFTYELMDSWDQNLRYMDIAESITGMKADKLDMDCPVCGSYLIYKRRYDYKKKKFRKNIAITIVGVAISVFVTIYALAHPLRWLGMHILLGILFFMFGKAGKNDKSYAEEVFESRSGIAYGVDLSSGRSGVWWIM